MDITDEMVERAFDALYPMVEAHPDMTQDQYQRHVYGIARAALTAALGDMEPLEDVLGTDYVVMLAAIQPSGRWYAEVAPVGIGAKRYWGLGSRIEWAIRNAVESAKGGKR